MKLKYTFEKMELDDKIMMVPVGDVASEFKGVVQLNESAAAIFELLKEETTEKEIIETLSKKYETSFSEITNYVHSYVKELTDAGLVE